MAATDMNAVVHVKDANGNVNNIYPATKIANVEGLQSALNAKADSTTVTNQLSGKVDKVTGKGLSTNDYTTTEKNKLAGIANNANAYTLPDATTSVKGGVIIGSNLSVSSGTLSLSETNVKNALGYLPLKSSGSKNLIVFLKTSEIEYNGSGLSFEWLENGKLKITGTATSPDPYVYVYFGMFYYESGKTFKISMSEAAKSTYCFTQDDKMASNIANAYTYSSDGSTAVLIRLQSSVAYNHEFNPMICLLTDYNADPSYEPYYPSMYDLYRRIVSLES
jgi:hypothetical protein